MKSAQLGERLGILGGGQLARMLAQAAQAMGLRPIVLARSADEPAAQVCPDAVLGEWERPEVLARFFAEAPTVIFENEFIRTEILRAAAESSEDPPRFVPSLESIHELQSKLRQKKLLERLGIETAPWRACPVDAATEASGRDRGIAAWVSELRAEWRDAIVLKWAELGYDGKGTWIAPRAWTREAEEAAHGFVSSAIDRGIEVYGERKVAFRKELAIVACRSLRGDFAAYPLAVSEQWGGICRRVLAPAVAFGTDPALEGAAVRAARGVADALSLEGAFAIEFFETDTGALWVNELAPRVHNTGHYTQNACAASQFENHVRAAIGLSLGGTELRGGGCAGMLNLLGPESISADARSGALPEVSRSSHLHWYGKSELRPGRKLGHLNAVASSPDSLREEMAELERIESAWASSLRSGTSGARAPSANPPKPERG